MNDPNRPATGYPAAAQPPPNPNGYCQPTPPSGTAYPYAAPHPPPSAAYYHHHGQNNPYYQPNPYAAPRTTFLRRIIGIVIACMVITGTFVFILWLILRPKLPEFTVDSFSVSKLNLNNSSLITANWDIGFTVLNPNKKMTIYYDDVAAAVFYDSLSLSDTTVAPFYQDKRTQMTLKASFATAGAYIDNRAFDEMNKEKSRKGSIGFNVRMVARVRFRSGFWRARRRFLRVYCKDLVVGVGSNNSRGNLIGGSRQCRVGL